MVVGVVVVGMGGGVTYQPCTSISLVSGVGTVVTGVVVGTASAVSAAAASTT